ncbi:SLATT domain-containing protein [Thermodesulfobacteriota bacterium]
MEEIAKNLVDECRRLEEDSMYNAESHYMVAASAGFRGQLLKFVMAAASAISGVLVLAGAASWVAWFSILSGLALALTTVLNIDRKRADHSSAAKEFTVLKHDARSLYQTFAPEMKRQEFSRAVRRLRDKYNDLVLHCPQTTKKAFQEAQRKIKTGVHTPDFVEQEKVAGTQEQGVKKR